MVTREYMARSALACDTSMSRAFLRALGVRVPEPVRPGRVVRAGGDYVYDGLGWCFRNYDDPAARRGGRGTEVS